MHSSPEFTQIGWWHLHSKLLIDKRVEQDWKSLIRVASSSYLMRIANLLGRIQKVESTAQQIS